MRPDSQSLAAFERKLGNLLTTGVLISAATLAVGLVLFLAFPKSAASSRLLTTGLFILMATPVLRVVISIIEYARMGDWLFVITTSIVLMQLTITFLLAM